MSFCQSTIIAHSDLQAKEIGVLDLINYLKSLVSGDEINQELEQTFNLGSFKNLSESQLKGKIASLKQLFVARNKELSDKRQKLIDVQIINDSELPHYEMQLETMKKIIANKDFNNSIKVIQNKMKLSYELSEGDKIKYSFYTELNEQVKYLENFKIGNKRDFVKRAQKHSENKTQYKNAINNLMRNVEMTEVLSVWADNTTKSIVEKLDGDFTKNMNASQLNLKGKVVRSLMNFLSIEYTRAAVIMSDKLFREKMFKNVNLEDVQNKLNIINAELNEHSIVKEYLRQEQVKIEEARIIKFKSGKDHMSRDPGFEVTVGGKIGGAIPDKIKNLGQLAKTLSLKDSMDKSLKSSYKVLLTTGLVDKSGYKQIEQVIDAELKQLENFEQMHELFGENAATQIIKNTIKIHVSRILLEKYNLDKNVFEPLNNASSMLSKLFGEKLDTIITNENLFNTIINYDTDEPMSQMKKSFNDMINFLIELKEEKNTMKRINNLLYKDFGTSIQISIKKGKQIKKIVKKTQAFADLSITNLLLLVSYAGTGSDFTADLLEKIAEQMELKESKTDTKPWSWATKENKKEIISTILNMTDGDYDFKAILADYIEDDDNKMEELKNMVRNINMSDLKKIQKQFNTLYDMFSKMYMMKVTPHNLNKMKLNKSLEEKQRTYFLGLMTGLYSKFTEELLSKSNTKKLKEYISKNIELLGMSLNKKSTFLQKPAEKRSAPAVVVEETKESDKDELLNDFMVEDLDDIEIIDDEIVEQDYDFEVDDVVEFDEEDLLE